MIHLNSFGATTHLEMGATDLDNVVKGLLLLEESGVELLEGGDERVGDLDDGRDVHSSGEAVQRGGESA